MKYYRRRYSIFLISICLVIPFVVQAAGVNPLWVNDGVVIPDDTYENVEVTQLDDGRYRMYYSQNGSILSNTSEDGREWVPEEGVRIMGAGMPAVVKLSDSTVRLYFTRQLDGKNAVYSATSVDGLSFTEEEGVRLQVGHPRGYDRQSGIVHPSVIQLSNGRYRLYYDTLYTAGDADTPWHILSAVSSDGLTFTVEKGIRIKGRRDMPKGTSMVWSPHIQKRKKQYQLFVTAQYDRKPLTRNGIYLATSRDGLTFSVQPDPIVYRSKKAGKKQNTNKGMNGAPQDPFVIRIDGADTLYYWIVEQGILRAHRR